MKVCNDPDYYGEYPENYHWVLIDSISLSNLATELAQQVKHELKNPPERRENVPGLRLALVLIARKAQL